MSDYKGDIRIQKISKKDYNHIKHMINPAADRSQQPDQLNKQIFINPIRNFGNEIKKNRKQQIQIQNSISPQRKIFQESQEEQQQIQSRISPSKSYPSPNKQLNANRKSKLIFDVDEVYAEDQRSPKFNQQNQHEYSDEENFNPATFNNISSRASNNNEDQLSQSVENKKTNRRLLQQQDDGQQSLGDYDKKLQNINEQNRNYQNKYANHVPYQLSKSQNTVSYKPKEFVNLSRSQQEYNNNRISYLQDDDERKHENFKDRRSISRNSQNYDEFGQNQQFRRNISQNSQNDDDYDYRQNQDQHLRKSATFNNNRKTFNKQENQQYRRSVSHINSYNDQYDQKQDDVSFDNEINIISPQKLIMSPQQRILSPQNQQHVQRVHSRVFIDRNTPSIVIENHQQLMFKIDSLQQHNSRLEQLLKNEYHKYQMLLDEISVLKIQHSQRAILESGNKELVFQIEQLEIQIKDLKKINQNQEISSKQKIYELQLQIDQRREIKNDYEINQKKLKEAKQLEEEYKNLNQTQALQIKKLIEQIQERNTILENNQSSMREIEQSFRVQISDYKREIETLKYEQEQNEEKSVKQNTQLKIDVENLKTAIEKYRQQIKEETHAKQQLQMMLDLRTEDCSQVELLKKQKRELEQKVEIMEMQQPSIDSVVILKNSEIQQLKIQLEFMSEENQTLQNLLEVNKNRLLMDSENQSEIEILKQQNYQLAIENDQLKVFQKDELTKNTDELQNQILILRNELQQKEEQIQNNAEALMIYMELEKEFESSRQNVITLKQQNIQLNSQMQQMILKNKLLDTDILNSQKEISNINSLLNLKKTENDRLKEIIELNKSVHDINFTTMQQGWESKIGITSYKPHNLQIQQNDLEFEYNHQNDNTLKNINNIQINLSDQLNKNQQKYETQQQYSQSIIQDNIDKQSQQYQQLMQNNVHKQEQQQQLFDPIDTQKSIIQDNIEKQKYQKIMHDNFDRQQLQQQSKMFNIDKQQQSTIQQNINKYEDQMVQNFDYQKTNYQKNNYYLQNIELSKQLQFQKQKEKAVDQLLMSNNPIKGSGFGRFNDNLLNLEIQDFQKENQINDYNQLTATITTQNQMDNLRQIQESEKQIQFKNFVQGLQNEQPFKINDETQESIFEQSSPQSQKKLRSHQNIQTRYNQEKKVLSSNNQESIFEQSSPQSQKKLRSEQNIQIRYNQEKKVLSSNNQESIFEQSSPQSQKKIRSEQNIQTRHNQEKKVLSPNKIILDDEYLQKILQKPNLYY